MGYLPNYKSPFRTFVKKQHKAFQAIVEDEVAQLCGDPTIGEAKTGDLVGIYVYKFKYSRQEYLLAYHVPEEQTLVICSAEDAPEQWRSPEFLLMDLYKLGTHENFYDDLKVYLRTNGWHK